LSNYWNAVQTYASTGSSVALDKFKGKTIKDDSGKTFELVTDHATVKRQANAGVLTFESIYSRS
jgi:hypothetical protein